MTVIPYPEPNSPGEGSRTTLVDNNFFNGLPWRISLSDIRSDALSVPLMVTILPPCTVAPIYFDARYDPRHEAKRQGAFQKLALDDVCHMPEDEALIGSPI